MRDRSVRGKLAYQLGCDAEARSEAALRQDGWDVRARRLRTAAGEIDLVAERQGVAAFIEVKARPSLRDAAFSLGARQQNRIMAATEIALAENPSWGPAGIRFDVMLVDQAGQVRRVADAFRATA